MKLPPQKQIIPAGDDSIIHNYIELQLYGCEPGTMNKTETEYVTRMIPALDGVISWSFEPLKFKIGQRCTYTPDFLIEFQDRWEVHETKGFEREDGTIKFKAAAHMYIGVRLKSKPITKFEMWQKKKRVWKKIREIGGR